MRMQTKKNSPIWFLDFESNKAGEIFLSGTLHNGKFQQTILDERLRGLEQYSSLEINGSIDFITSLVFEINNSGGILVAYGNLEKELIERVYLHSGSTVPDYQYCNLHRVTKKWIKRYKLEEFKYFLNNIGSSVIIPSHPKSKHIFKLSKEFTVQM